MADVTKEIEKLRKDIENMEKEIRSIYTMLERLFVEKEDK